jgi:SAM-dependent methyltransferase
MSTDESGEPLDEIADTNQQHWERMVDEACGFTIPWLDLDVDAINRYIRGDLATVPENLGEMYPARLLEDIADKDVLCLASGGGQQSSVFGLLGARVTVVDLTEGQLVGDRRAAAHYGYPVITRQADMRDLSCLDDGAFDLVWQAPSLSYVAEVRPVFTEVRRVLRLGGIYRAEFGNPATQFVDMDDWDGEGYRISVPYAVRRLGDSVPADYRHFLQEIFNGLIGEGFAFREVLESPHHFRSLDGLAPGGWDHWLSFVAGQFCVVAATS